MFLVSMPVLAGSAIAAAVFVAFTLAAFVLFRRAYPGEASQDLKNAFNWGALRIGTIHALILAFMFAEVRQEYNDLTETIEQEALAVEQLYRTLDGIANTDANTLKRQLADYTRMVIEKEWPSLGEGRALVDADRRIDVIRRGLVDLAWSEAGSAHARSLLTDINDLETMRGQRAFDVEESLADVFWLIGIAGYIFTSVSFFAYSPTLARCLVLGMFASINGVVFYGIVALTHPFVGGAAISPFAFETVYERTMARQ